MSTAEERLTAGGKVTQECVATEPHDRMDVFAPMGEMEIAAAIGPETTATTTTTTATIITTITTDST